MERALYVVFPITMYNVPAHLLYLEILLWVALSLLVVVELTTGPVTAMKWDTVPIDVVPMWTAIVERAVNRGGAESSVP